MLTELVRQSLRTITHLYDPRDRVGYPLIELKELPTLATSKGIILVWIL